MNAFQRGQAVTHLENLSLIIAIHCVMVASYPENEAINHWNGELDGFIKTLKRYNRGKKGRSNFNLALAEEIISEHVTDPDDQEAIEAYIHEKGLDSEKIDWEKSKTTISGFVFKIFD